MTMNLEIRLFKMKNGGSITAFAAFVAIKVLALKLTTSLSFQKDTRGCTRNASWERATKKYSKRPLTS